MCYLHLTVSVTFKFKNNLLKVVQSTSEVNIKHNTRKYDIFTLTQTTSRRGFIKDCPLVLMKRKNERKE